MEDHPGRVDHRPEAPRASSCGAFRAPDGSSGDDRGHPLPPPARIRIPQRVDLLPGGRDRDVRGAPVNPAASLSTAGRPAAPDLSSSLGGGLSCGISRRSDLQGSPGYPPGVGNSKRASTDRALARRGLRLQDRPGTELRAILGGLTARADPDLLVGSATSDDAAVYRLAERAGPGPDRRLLHPDRRRPVRLRPGRRRQRPLRHLRDGRRAAARAQPRRLPAGRARRGGPRRDPRAAARRSREAAGVGSPAATRSTTPSRSTGWPSPGSSTPSASHERGRAAGRRARPDQAARRPA